MKHIIVGIYMTALLFSLLFVIENVLSKLNYYTLIPSVVFLIITFAILSFSRDENKKQ